MPAGDAYTGGVCYMGGWHWTLEKDAAGFDTPGERLVLDDDGSYRVAGDADTESWHDRKHQRFATVEMEDGSTLRITPDELEDLMRKRRGG